MSVEYADGTHENDRQFYTIYDDMQMTTVAARLVTIPICPDLLEYNMIGEADNTRGRTVRAFFWVMKLWPV